MPLAATFSATPSDLLATLANLQNELFFFLLAIAAYMALQSTKLSLKKHTKVGAKEKSTTTSSAKRQHVKATLKPTDSRLPEGTLACCNHAKELLKNGSLEEAQAAVEDLKGAEMALNIAAFNSVLAAAIASKSAFALKMFEDIQAYNVVPDRVTFSVLLKSVSTKASGNLEKIMDAIQADVAHTSDEVLIGSVVEACLRAGHSNLLGPFLRRLRASSGLAMKGAHTYSSLIRAYGYLHDVEGAWSVWNDMIKNHVAPVSVTLGCMVEALVTNGDIEGGYQLIKKLAQDEKTSSLVNAVTYGSILKGFSHAKQFDRMWEVYDEMVAQKVQFSMATYNTLIDACSRAGDLDRVPSLLQDVNKQGLKLGIVTYGALLKGCCSQNQVEEAFEMVEEMRRSTDLVPDEVMYNTLLDGCARRGLFDRGIQVLEDMRASKVAPSNFTLSVLVKMANRGNKLDKAFELCKEISSSYGFRLNVHVFNNLIQACIARHDLSRGFGVLERMLKERVRPDLRTYNLLLRASIDSKRAYDADGLVRSACALRQPHPRLMHFGLAVQPQGGLPSDVISEVLSGLLDRCKEHRLAADLFVELSTDNKNLKLDPKLRMRLLAAHP